MGEDQTNEPGSPVPREPSALLRALRARTPARILVGRAGPSYRTATQLQLRQDHAAALDAVHAEIDLHRDLGGLDLFEVNTRARTKEEYLLHPHLGRQLSEEARTTLLANRARGADLQVVVGDGLSAAAVAVQAPRLLPLIVQEADRRGWRCGTPFFIRHCRVGVLNDIGELLSPEVVVLLIGERPGLATAESLSAYMAYRPRAGHTDAQRNLISNIHARGVPPEMAAPRILALADQMRRLGVSGVAVKEELPALEDTSAAPPLPAPRERHD
jgi:ethanolamine ammonia-lyase small subunit